MKNNTTAINELEAIVEEIVMNFGLEDSLTITAYTLLATAKRGEMEAESVSEALLDLANARCDALLLDAIDNNLEGIAGIITASVEEAERAKEALSKGEADTKREDTLPNKLTVIDLRDPAVVSITLPRNK